MSSLLDRYLHEFVSLSSAWDVLSHASILTVNGGARGSTSFRLSPWQLRTISAFHLSWGPLQFHLRWVKTRVAFNFTGLVLFVDAWATCLYQRSTQLLFDMVMDNRGIVRRAILLMTTCLCECPRVPITLHLAHGCLVDKLQTPFASLA